jgi:hypothetical protein
MTAVSILNALNPQFLPPSALFAMMTPSYMHQAKVPSVKKRRSALRYMYIDSAQIYGPVHGSDLSEPEPDPLNAFSQVRSGVQQNQ